MADCHWALTGLGLALLVLLVLPRAQINLAASQLHGLIGSYTDPGHYGVAYSGGTTTINTNTPTDYSAGTSQNAPGAWGGGGNVYGTGTISAKCAGQITAAFTWSPGPNNAPAPPAGSVIVTETANAAWSGPGSTGSCGLPNFTSSPNAPNQTGTRYSVQGGSSFSVNCTPTASLSGYTAPGNQVIGGGVYVGYAATASPVTINLNGPNAANQVLTGQQVTAQLVGAPANVTSYTWSFTGGTPIKNWDPTWPNSAHSSTQTIPLAPTDLSQTDTTGQGISVAPISFYYTKAGMLTVSCTMTLLAPNSTTTPVTVQSSQISYMKPTVTWNPGTAFGTLTNPGFFAGYPNGPFGSLEPIGPIKITVPNQFSGGTGCVVQIANLDRSWANTKPVVYSSLSVLKNDGTTGMVKAPTGLDVGFPYPFGFDEDAQGNLTVNNNKYTWQVSGRGFVADKPIQSYTLAAQQGAGTYWYSSTANDHFNTWAMYRPPPVGGQGTIYVPLQTFKWSWGGNASLSNNVWSANEGPPYISEQPTTTDGYPSWSQEIPFGFTVGP